MGGAGREGRAEHRDEDREEDRKEDRAEGVFRQVFGTRTMPTGTPVAFRRGETVIHRPFATAALPTDASVASSGSHCELVHRIVAELGFVKFTWHEPLLIIK